MSDKDWFHELFRIVAQLRSDKGCPWDRQQTHSSLKRYLFEEAAEVLDAIDDEDDSALEEELGDVLLQIALHAQIAAEEGRFDAQGVAERICDKMIRRHPHVFGDAVVADAEGVVTQWEAIKRQERQAKATPGSPPSVLAGVPKHLPALHRAYKIQKKASQVGFDWPDAQGVLAKIEEELAEVRQALADRDQESIAEEVGDLLFAITNLSRFLGFFPEDQLHDSTRKFEKRFSRMEQKLREGGKAPETCSLEELDALWQRTRGKGNGKK
ncbi:MAG: nucleoside triphosphate pyrophosphohydrolase [Planctomycetes bacterium]|nr:nucleoside triphosphate pyrophosphohydrolase [Planctomycetota bacterium]